MWQHVNLSEQIGPWDTLTCCWDVKQPTNSEQFPQSCPQNSTSVAMLIWWTQILPDPWRWNVSYSSLCSSLLQAVSAVMLWGRNHGGRTPSSDDNFHSPTSIPASPLDKLNIMKRYHHRQTCSHTSTHHSPMMVTLHDTRFVEWRWWNDGWTVKTVITWWLSACGLVVMFAVLTSLSSPSFQLILEHSVVVCWLLNMPATC